MEEDVGHTEVLVMFNLYVLETMLLREGDTSTSDREGGTWMMSEEQICVF